MQIAPVVVAVIVVGVLWCCCCCCCCCCGFCCCCRCCCCFCQKDPKQRLQPTAVYPLAQGLTGYPCVPVRLRRIPPCTRRHCSFETILGCTSGPRSEGELVYILVGVSLLTGHISRSAAPSLALVWCSAGYSLGTAQRCSGNTLYYIVLHPCCRGRCYDGCF